METQEQKIKAFAELLEQDQIAYLHSRNLACEANVLNAKVSTKQGKKYVKIDVGPSGKYMVEISTEKIYGIKAYGVIHQGHCYGTLDEINQWYWGDYTATRKQQAEPVMDGELLLRHAKSSLTGIERKLDLCNVPEHEKREIMQMVYAYASYCSQVDEAHKIADKNY